MREEKIILLEKYLEGILSEEENRKVKDLLLTDSEFKSEFDEQKRIKEMMNKMNLKNPSVEFWDSYWLNTYNKVERGFAWILISIGALILLGFAAFNFTEALLKNTDIPEFIKYSLAFVIFGGAILLFSVLREKILVNSKERYKEIQRWLL